MDRLESIKEGFKMWDNQYPLHPPETRAQEMAQEHVKLLAKGFEQDAPKYVGYLLQRLERYETALKEIISIKDEPLLEPECVMASYAEEALKDEAIQP